jgi:hypothetical protein
MGYCGVVEVQSLEDALGATCGCRAKSDCSDCGVSLCSAHAERCTLCEETFCPSCLSFHRAQHIKSAAVGREQRRPARTA